MNTSDTDAPRTQVRHLFRASLGALERGVANYSQLLEETANSAEVWARVQADGQSRSVLPPAALGRVAAQMPLLGKLFNVEEALSPSGPKLAQNSGPLSPGRKEKVMRHTCSGSLRTLCYIHSYWFSGWQITRQAAPWSISQAIVCRVVTGSMLGFWRPPGGVGITVLLVCS